MSDLATKMLRIRFDAIRETLQATGRDEKGDHVAIPTAEEFNAIVVELGNARTELKPHLPLPIKTKLSNFEFHAPPK